MTERQAMHNFRTVFKDANIGRCAPCLRTGKAMQQEIRHTLNNEVATKQKATQRHETAALAYLAIFS